MENEQNTEKMYVTEEGLRNLKAELDNLIHVRRPEVIEQLAEARAQGDLSENADYDAARDEQAKLEQRILELEAQIKNAEIIEEPAAKGGEAAVHLGSTVTVMDLSDNQEDTYSIVGTIEADPFANRISNDSPFAKSIMDHHVGDQVTIHGVAEPYDVKILSIE